MQEYRAFSLLQCTRYTYKGSQSWLSVLSERIRNTPQCSPHCTEALSLYYSSSLNSFPQLSVCTGIQLALSQYLYCVLTAYRSIQASCQPVSSRPLTHCFPGVPQLIRLSTAYSAVSERALRATSLSGDS